MKNNFVSFKRNRNSTNQSFFLKCGHVCFIDYWLTWILKDTLGGTIPRWGGFVSCIRVWESDCKHEDTVMHFSLLLMCCE